MIYISLPDLYILCQICISWARFVYLGPDLYILGQICISWARFVYLGPDLYILGQIYISWARFIYLGPDLYILGQIYISWARFISFPFAWARFVCMRHVIIYSHIFTYLYTVITQFVNIRVRGEASRPMRACTIIITNAIFNIRVAKFIT